MTRWTTEIRHDPGVFADLAEWWDSQSAVQRVPYVHSQILRCWEPGFDEPSSKLHVALLRREGELVAALPMYQARGRLRTLSRVHADLLDAVVVDDQEVIDHLPRWVDSWPIAHLYRLAEDSPIVRALPRYPRWSLQSVYESPFVDLSQGMDDVRNGFSKQFTKSLRRRRRRLEELGTVRFVDHPSASEIETVLERGMRLEAQGWKGRQGVAVSNDPTQEKWYRSVARVAQDHDWLRLSALYLDDQMLAFSFDLEYRGRRYSKFSAYDEEVHASLSTGSLLLESILEHVSARGIGTYEFGYGNQPWKYDWTSDVRRVYDVLVLGSTALGRTMAITKKARRAWKDIRTGPAV